MGQLFLRRCLLGALLSLLWAGPPPASAAAYDPLAVPNAELPAPLDLVVHDATRSRDVPVYIYLPTAKTAAPVIIFSHGLGGTRKGYAYLGPHWAARGYVCVCPQHAGSDDGVWQGKSRAEGLAAMHQAVSAQNLILRAGDIHAVLDQLTKWNADSSSPLHDRLDLAHVGMSGHSFGAVTTQAVSGESFPFYETSNTDPRIKAALPMSPSTPHGEDATQAFAGVKIPWLLMTGTRDDSPLGDRAAASRLDVYPALPAGGKYELVLDGARHSAFSDGPLPGDDGAANPNHHRAILALSTAFWDAYLRDDPAAKKWLDGAGPQSVLEPADHWQHK